MAPFSMIFLSHFLGLLPYHSLVARLQKMKF